jgi:pyruvate, water dikinase
VPPLDEFEDPRVVMEATGVAQNHYVRENFHRCLDLFSKMWHHHTEFLMLGYGAYVVFFEFCKNAFPEISEQTVARMVAGIDVIMYRPDDELKRLARLAVESGLADEFPEGCDPDEVLARLAERGEAGREWLAAFDAARHPWFHVSTGDGFYHHHLSWNENLTVPFAALTRYVRQVGAGETLERPTSKLLEERDRITAEYRALLATEEDRGAFDQMLGVCRLVSLRRGPQVLLRALVHDAVLPEDTGVRRTARQPRRARGGGGRLPPPALRDRPGARRRDAGLGLGRRAARRRAPAADHRRAQAGAGGAPFVVATTGTRPGAGGAQRPGRADAVGHHPGHHRVLVQPGQHRQREGGARLRRLLRHRGGNRPGAARRQRDRAEAAVSDIGGTMSHAAIVAREYGMPAVVGTGQATRRIRTGHRVRVDGDRGVVTILD